MSEQSRFPATARDTPTPGGSHLVTRWLPMIVLAVAGAAVFTFDLDRYLSFEALKTHRHALMLFVEQRMLFAIALFILLYAAATAVSLPGGTLLSIAGGFLFGPWFGTAYVVIGATIGATAVFLIARSALGDSLRRRAGPALTAMERGFQKNALSYLLVLRLVPLFPFFLVNLVPAFLGVPLRTYVIGTFVGIIPGAFVFVFAGAGLGSVFDSAERFSPASVMTPEVLVALTGLGLLSLSPILYKRLKARRSQT